MINRGQKHTQAKAYQETYNQYLILQIRMNFEKLKIKNSQAYKQKTAAQVSPYVDLYKIIKRKSVKFGKMKKSLQFF